MTDPLLTELPDSIVFIERDWLSSNQLLFIDGEGDQRRATLLDSGYAKHADLTVRLVSHLLAQRDLPITALRTLINTHLHSDHCGGNAALVAASGCRVLVPQADYDNALRWDPQGLTFAGTGQRCERFHPDGWIAPGDELMLGGLRWQVLAAPGHHPHSVILHCPEHRLLISADALWENGFGVIFPELDGESGFDEQQAMLELIESLDVLQVFPGHGRPFSDVADAIARARSRLAAFRADARRNARNALRVLVKFLLLDMERIELDRLQAQVADATIMRNAAAQLGLPLADAIAIAVDDLERGAQLKRQGSLLMNNEPASDAAA